MNCNMYLCFKLDKVHSSIEEKKTIISAWSIYFLFTKATTFKDLHIFNDEFFLTLFSK